MRHRQRPYQSRRPSSALWAAAAMAVAVPVLALPPAAQATPENSPGLPGETGQAGEPDLVVSALPTTLLTPGETSRASVTVTNNGTAPADGIVFRVRLTRGLDFPESAPGCSYTTTGDQIRQSLCHLAITIEPGASATVPVPIKVLPKALMEVVEYGTSPTGEEPGGYPGQGDGESYRYTLLDADNTADLAALGDQVKGRPGQTVTVRAALRNDGPGWVQNKQSDDQPALMVKIPEGTVAVQVPSDCSPFEIDGPSGPSQPGKPQYVCSPPDYTLDVGSVHAYTFKLKIKKTAHSTSGEVKATSVYDIHPDFDHNAANDKAAISVVVRNHRPVSHAAAAKSASGTASAPGGTGSPGADGAQSPAAATSQTQKDKRSMTALTSHTSSAAHRASGGTGILAFLAAGAMTAVGLGGLATVTVRRRRTTSA